MCLEKWRYMDGWRLNLGPRDSKDELLVSYIPKKKTPNWKGLLGYQGLPKIWQVIFRESFWCFFVSSYRWLVGWRKLLLDICPTDGMFDQLSPSCRTCLTPRKREVINSKLHSPNYHCKMCCHCIFDVFLQKKKNLFRSSTLATSLACPAGN